MYFQNMCHEIYKINPGRFLTETGLAWKAALKRGESHSINQHAKASSKYTKDYDKDIEA